jgi:hypothetical protein
VVSPPRNGPASLDKEWARRKIGVLFSGKDGKWTFIVLVGPEKEELEVHTKDTNVTGPERGFVHLQVDKNPDKKIANALSRNGEPVYCKDAQYGVENIINYITAELKKQGPGFLEWIVREIFWGWGEFLKQMRLPILKVISFIHAHSHAAQ